MKRHRLRRLVATPAIVATHAERFWSKVKKAGPDDCWLWQRHVDRATGYGRYHFLGRAINAHRVAALLHFGSIPAGRQACHKCDVRTCCNPKHLFLGTAEENMQDMSRKGRASRMGNRRAHVGE